MQGDRLDNVAAQVSGRPGAVLAPVRRQRRDAPGRADRDDRPTAAHHAAGRHPGTPECLKGIHLTLYDRTRWCRCRCRKP